MIVNYYVILKISLVKLNTIKNNGDNEMKAISKVVSCMSSLLLVSSLSAGAASAAEYKWDMPNEYPGTSIQGIGDRYFSNQLKDKSQGKIEIVHHFGGALGYKSKDQLDAVEDGAVVIANTFIPPLGGVNPIFLLSSLPFLSSNVKEANLLYTVAKPYYDEVLNKHNQKLLYASPWPSSGLWGKDAYTSKEKIERLKLRTYDANGTRTFKSVNASPIQLSWADIVPQLSTGGIDAVLTSVESGINASFNDYTKFFTELNYDSTINLVTMNLDAWEKLTPELQKAVTDAAQATETFVWKNVEIAITKNYDTAKTRGVTVVTDVDTKFRDELKQAAEPVIEDWAKKMGPKGQELLDIYKSELSKLN